MPQDLQTIVDTTIALDILATCLLKKLKGHTPELASALAHDLRYAAEQAPRHLPPEFDAVRAKLVHWHTTLTSAPKPN